MADIPMIISVDDHVVEPPDLWTSRLPKKYLDRGPRVERDSAVFHFEGGNFTFEKGVEGGEPCDWWLYDDLVYPFPKLSAAVGFPELDVTPTTFDEIRAGCWKQPERLADMDANYTEASICFPNTLPRFCGQTFYERADHDLALLCVQAYNDWVIDEWCAGDGKGRLIPLALLPLWDVDLCVQEIQRCREQGLLRGHLPGEPVPARPALDPRQEQALGPGVRRVSRHRDRHLHAHRLELEDAHHVTRRAVHRELHAHVLERDGLDGRLHLLRHVGALPEAHARVQRGPGGLDAVRDGTRRQALGRAQRELLRHRVAGAAVELREADLRLHLRRRDRPRQPRRDRHGPDLLRDRLPARRLHVPALQGHRGEDLLGSRA